MQSRFTRALYLGRSSFPNGTSNCVIIFDDSYTMLRKYWQSWREPFTFSSAAVETDLDAAKSANKLLLLCRNKTLPCKHVRLRIVGSVSEWFLTFKVLGHLCFCELVLQFFQTFSRTVNNCSCRLVVFICCFDTLRGWNHPVTCTYSAHNLIDWGSIKLSKTFHLDRRIFFQLREH